MRIEIDDTMEERVIETIGQLVTRQIDERIKTAVRAAIKESIDTKIATLADDAIRPVMEAVIAEGWRKTDSYGTPSGPPLSLRDRVQAGIKEYIEARVQNGYGNTRGDAFVREVIEKELKGDIGKMLNEAKAALKGQIDAVLNGKLRQAMADTLGLKVG